MHKLIKYFERNIVQFLKMFFVYMKMNEIDYLN